MQDRKTLIQELRLLVQEIREPEEENYPRGSLDGVHAAGATLVSVVEGDYSLQQTRQPHKINS